MTAKSAQVANLKKAFAEHNIPWPSERKRRTLFMHPTGPLLQYADGTLHIADLNPEMKTQWLMSRMEMLALGWRCIIASLRG